MEKAIGRVLTKMTVTNRRDQIFAEEGIAEVVSYQNFQHGMALKTDNYNDTMVEKILKAAEEPLVSTMSGEEFSAWLNSQNPLK